MNIPLTEFIELCKTSDIRGGDGHKAYALMSDNDEPGTHALVQGKSVFLLEHTRVDVDVTGCFTIQYQDKEPLYIRLSKGVNPVLEARRRWQDAILTTAFEARFYELEGYQSREIDNAIRLVLGRHIRPQDELRELTRRLVKEGGERGYFDTSLPSAHLTIGVPAAAGTLDSRKAKVDELLNRAVIGLFDGGTHWNTFQGNNHISIFAQDVYDRNFAGDADEHPPSVEDALTPEGESAESVYQIDVDELLRAVLLDFDALPYPTRAALLRAGVPDPYEV